MFCFHVLISGRRGLNMCGRGCGCLWLPLDRSDEEPRLFARYPDYLAVVARPFARCWIGSLDRLSNCACPRCLYFWWWFLMFPFHQWSSRLPPLWRRPLALIEDRGSPMTMLFSLYLSAMSRQTKTFLSFRSITFIGKDRLWTCRSWKLNWPSFIADCTCQRNTLQSLVSWENKLCHLQ
jgi:hypothetical protein